MDERKSFERKNGEPIPKGNPAKNGYSVYLGRGQFISYPHYVTLI